MTPDDKQRLKDAFTKAIANLGPAAAEPVEGMATPDGRGVTRGQLLQMMADSRITYKVIDEAVGRGEKTVDDYVREIENIGKPRAPKP